MRKRSNELAKRLLEEGERMNRKEFLELVNKGVFKDTEEDYTKFVICKYCNYNNHDTNCCTILPEVPSLGVPCDVTIDFRLEDHHRAFHPFLTISVNAPHAVSVPCVADVTDLFNLIRLNKH